MDLELTAEQLMLQETVRKFVREKIAPVVPEYEARGQLSKEAAHGFLKMLQPFGLVGSLVSEEHGGPGLSYLDKAIISFELAKVWPSLSGMVGITSGVALGVDKTENGELREKYLPGLLSGELIGCTCITEPNVGSDPSQISTTAVLDGDHYVINGNKTWISNGSIADVAVVLCRDKSSESGRGGLFNLFVDRSESAFEAREIHKLGLRAFPTSEIFFEDCRVPKGNVLFGIGEGFDKAQRGLIGARVATALTSVAIGEASLEASVEYARERVQFGRPIGKFQVIQTMIADMVIMLEAARHLTFSAFRKLDAGEACRMESSIAKAYACEVGWKIASMAMEIHGAYGYAEEYPVERYFRDARCFTIPDGTTEIQKLVIGREALAMSALK